MSKIAAPPTRKTAAAVGGPTPTCPGAATEGRTLTAAATPTPPAWRASPVPSGFVVSERGLFTTDPDGRPAQRVTLRPALVDALVRDAHGESWSVRLRWITPDGAAAERTVPLGEVLAWRQNGLLAALTDAGLIVLEEREFRDFLALSLDDPRVPRLQGVTKLGFAPVRLRSGESSLCWVLPDETLYVDPTQVAEPVILLPQAKVLAHRAYFTRASRDSWKAMVEPTRENPLQTFALCSALAGPLLWASETENGGFHFYGATSHGKTLALQLACTVWGNGAASNLDASTPTLMHPWSATDNALDRIAEAHSDTVLALDEIGSRTGQAAAIYRLVNGQGRARLTATCDLHEARTWTVLILSSGEISTQAQIETTGRRRVNAGELIRLLDVPIATLVAAGDAAAAQELKRACGQHFGTAGPAFVRGLLKTFDGDAEWMRETVRHDVDGLWTVLSDEVRASGRDLPPHHWRALRRLALVEFAGLLAAGEILPHTEAEVRAAVRAVRDAWLGGQSFTTDAERAIEAVRDYVQRYWGQMLFVSKRGEPHALPANCHGIVDGNRLILTTSNFREACDGLEPQMVAQALKDTGILHTNEDQKKVKYSNAKLGISQLRHYILYVDRLGAGTDPDDDTETHPEAWVDDALDDALEETHGPEEWDTGPHRFGSLDGF